MKDAVIRARIDAKLKADAVAVLAGCGLEVSDAIRLFLVQVVAQRGLPFAVRGVAVDAARHPPQDFGAMERVSRARDPDFAASVHDESYDPFLIRREELIGARIKWPDARLDE